MLLMHHVRCTRTIPTPHAYEIDDKQKDIARILIKSNMFSADARAIQIITTNVNALPVLQITPLLLSFAASPDSAV